MGFTHSNGLGQVYLACNPLGTPGDPSTYTQMMADFAGYAWLEANGTTPDKAFIKLVGCGGVGDTLEVSAANSSPAYFVFAGDLAGYVGVGVCPNNHAATWN